MNGDGDILDDFLGEVKDRTKRGPVEKAPIGEVPAGKAPDQEAVTSEEYNTFQAAMGFGFKCGVCEKFHRASLGGQVKSAGLCIRAALIKVGAKASVRGTRRYRTVVGDISVGPGASIPGIRILPSPESPEKMVLYHKTIHKFNHEVPTSEFLRVAYPKLAASFDEAVKRVEEVYSREITEEIDLKEVVGRPGTVYYLRARMTAFMKMAHEEVLKIEASRDPVDPELLGLMKNWRKIKPEKWSVGAEMANGWGVQKWFRGKSPSENGQTKEPIQTIKINGKPLHYDSVLQWFNRVSTNPVLGVNVPSSTSHHVLFDVGTYDGFPAISYGIVSVDTKYRPRKDNITKGVSLTAWVSTSDGRMWLNMSKGEVTTLRDIKKAHLLSVSPTEGQNVDEAN